jgi:hypothetical protein
MTVFLWLAFVLLVLLALPCMPYFSVYLATVAAQARDKALRFYRWAALVVLAAFHITIFKHIIQTIAERP